MKGVVTVYEFNMSTSSIVPETVDRIFIVAC